MEENRGGRLLGLAFIAIVLVAVTLLIAGYGVAVGAGALVGFILGGLAGMVGRSWAGRGSGGFYTFGHGSSAESGQAAFFGEIQAMGEIHSVNTGAVRMVIPVLADAEAAGLVVTLVTVELHEAAVVATFDVVTRPGASAMFAMATVSVRDDAGTQFRAASQGQGDGAGSMRLLATAIPAPSPSATRLDITIERFFDPFPEGRQSQAGPWSFVVALPVGAQ